MEQIDQQRRYRWLHFAKLEAQNVSHPYRSWADLGKRLEIVDILRMAYILSASQHCSVPKPRPIARCNQNNHDILYIVMIR